MGSVREEIAKSLLYHRKTKRITQKELADYLGVKNSAVSNWEKGVNSIDIDTLHRACIFFEISVNEMFGAYANVQNTNSLTVPDQNELLRNYNELNDVGQQALLEQSRMMRDNPTYKKAVQSKSVSKNA